MIKVLIADDHHVVRQGVKQLLQTEGGFIISGEAANGRDVLDLLNNGIEADVLLADVNMPEMDGLELTRILHEKFGNMAIVLLTMQEDDNFIQNAFDNGITSYVFKSANPEELVFALRQASAGRPFVCSSLTDRLIKRAASTRIARFIGDSHVVEFSSREMEVLQLIADGFTNEEAADKLFTSRRTVEGHRQSMIDKTGARNSLALVRFAMRNGLLD